VSYTWVRRRERKRIPYENPQGRRVNVLAALVKHGATPALYWILKPGSLRGEHLVRFLQALPSAPQPTVVVLDNGSMHRNAVAKAAIPDLWRAGIYLFFLPPYSPDLNEIEPAFRVIKHHELPERRYTSVPSLVEAVRSAFTTYEEKLIAKHLHQPWPAA
jgi:putative transposase